MRLILSSVALLFAITGMVFAHDGGVIPRLAKIARAGGAGPIAGGRQWVPWVAVDDVVGALDAYGDAVERRLDLADVLPQRLGEVLRVALARGAGGLRSHGL